MRFFYLVLLLWLQTTTLVFPAPLIEEQRSLDFGTLAIVSNASISRYTYPASGSDATIEGQFVLISSGAPGSYLLTGFPASTQLTISVDSAILATDTTGVSEPLDVDDYEFPGALPEVTTDTAGEAELSLGARLSTTGSGVNYVDASYDSTTILRVDYFDSVEESFLTETQIINLQTQLRSALTIDEEQALGFGTLFARSSASDQAALTLSPGGAYSISEPGDTRLVSIEDPEQGVFRITGAAPFYNLTITIESADVLLEHAINPDVAPHFILTDLLTSPSISGTTDDDGELLIETGGTLKTELTASPTIYPSGQYEGIYQLTVSY